MYGRKSSQAVIQKAYIQGISTRLVDELVKAMRPIEGDWPYLWIDATYVKSAKPAASSVAVIIAVAVSTDGVREILGVATGRKQNYSRQISCAA